MRGSAGAPVRVCFFHADPEWSGRARAFADAAGALRARGHEVTLVCARGGAVERRLRASAYEVIGLRTDDGALRTGWRLREVLRGKFVEVVFVHSDREQLGAAAAVRFADRGAVVRRVSPLAQLGEGHAARLARWIAATGFLFSTERDFRAALPLAGMLEPAVAPPGVAHAPPAAADPREPGTRALVVLYDTPHRGRLSAALGALALLAQRHPSMRATLLGPAGDTDALRMHAAALRLGGSVDIADGTSDHATLLRRIATADLGLVLAEGDDAAFGVLDCLASGVPVITERNALSATFVADGESGALTDGLDAAGYAALIAGLLADDSRRVRLSRAARAAAARWPLDAMADGFERAARAAHDRSRWRV